MIFTNYTELEEGKFYYCVGVNSAACITVFSNLPDPTTSYYETFTYIDYWTPSSGFLEATATCCYEDISDMQHYLLPDVNSPEDVELYIKSHPELAL
jgi:hypothetical protein